MAPFRLSKLSEALEELGIDMDLSTFGSRLELQKSLYLLQEAGQKMHYSYGWYLSGPYSPDLTRDLFDLQELERVSKPEDLETDGHAMDREATKKTRNLIEDLKKLGDTAYWLELTASLHFLNEHAYPRPTDSKQLMVELEESKPHRFRAEDVKRAYDLLLKHGFLTASISE